MVTVEGRSMAASVRERVTITRQPPRRARRRRARHHREAYQTAHIGPACGGFTSGTHAQTDHYGGERSGSWGWYEPVAGVGSHCRDGVGTFYYGLHSDRRLA